MNATHVHCCLLACSFTSQPLQNTISNCLLCMELSHLETQFVIVGWCYVVWLSRRISGFGKWATKLVNYNEQIACIRVRGRQWEREVKWKWSKLLKEKRNAVKLKECVWMRRVKGHNLAEVDKSALVIRWHGGFKKLGTTEKWGIDNNKSLFNQEWRRTSTNTIRYLLPNLKGQLHKLAALLPW